MRKGRVNRWTLALAGAFFAAGLHAQNQAAYPPDLPDATVETYKSVGGVDLRLWIFAPEGHSEKDRRPAAVFFFGGGWRAGTPAQFAPHCRYLASRGMVAMVADYRVASRHGVKIVSCVEDAKSAIRFVRANAKRLGADPDRIAAGGGSAGGHLAAATATVPGHEAPGENRNIHSSPDALLLFNPALMLAPPPAAEPESWRIRLEGLRERAGVDLLQISPHHHIRRGTPPTIIFHGKADETVPYATAAAFCARMKQLHNRCQLVGYDGAGHGFFNHGREGGQAYKDTVRHMDRFLASLSWLTGEPTL